LPNVAARIISKPPENTRTVLQSDGAYFGPFIRGNGKTTYICGNCKTALLENIYPHQVRNIVFKCPKCGSYNELP